MNVRQADRTGPFSVMAVLAMVAVGIIAFAAFLVLLAFADDLRNPNDGREHALSRSAIGFAGIVSLLHDLDHPVRISRSTLGEATTDNAFVILTPSPGHEIELDDIYSLYSSLIVLPKWQTREQKNNPAWVERVGLLKPATVEATMEQLAFDLEVRQSSGAAVDELVDLETGGLLPIGPIPNLQSIKSEYLEPIITDNQQNVILAELLDDDGDTIAYVLSDPDLLNTHGLSSPLTARAAVTIVEKFAAAGEPIAFDVTLHGLSRSRNMLQLAFSPPFLPAVLCVVFAGVLIAVVAMSGHPRAAGAGSIPLGKLTLVDNSAKLIVQAGRNQGVAERYVAMIRRQALKALGISTTATEAQQSAMLDTLRDNARQPGASKYSELAGSVASVTGAPAMVRAMKQLYKWKQELGRERNRR